MAPQLWREGVNERDAYHELMRAAMWRRCGEPRKFRREDAALEPEQKCPSYRVVAEPCAQGFRLKRYEQVAGTAELVLVSVEIVSV